MKEEKIEIKPVNKKEEKSHRSYYSKPKKETKKEIEIIYPNKKKVKKLVIQEFPNGVIKQKWGGTRAV